MTTVTVKDILIKAKELISQPGAWTQGEIARDASGNLTEVLGEDATCFCTLGAIYKAAHDLDAPNDEDLKAINHMRKVLDYPLIATWNDNIYRTQEDVIALFTKVIEKV